MITRVFRSLAPALAALGLLTLRPAAQDGLSAPPVGEAGRVVFRHYL